MTRKTLFKLNSDQFNSQYDVPTDVDVMKQEICSVKNNKMVTRRILESGIDIIESTFERQDLEEVILSNIEIQFSLYQFYVMYSDVENKEVDSNQKFIGNICYTNEEHRLSDLTLSTLLSVFDSLHVVYKKNKIEVQTTLSSLDSKMKIFNLYKRLYDQSLLNPLIISFISKKKRCKLEINNSIVFQYKPCEADISAVVPTKEEMIFISFIQQQLKLSHSYQFYCLGWNEEDVTGSMELKTLAKYFNKIFFISTSDTFLSQMLIIYN